MRADPEPWTDPRRPVAGSADPGAIHGARDRAGRGGGPPDRPRPRERAALLGDPTTARRPEDGGGPARRAREALHGGQARGGPRPRASTSRARPEVRDTGPGIPTDALPRIFDAFFSTQAPGEGTGLGLWLTYATVERHEGTLIAANRPDGGAAFTIELPLSPA